MRLSTTPWTSVHQAPLSMRFPRQEYWSGLPFPSPGGQAVFFFFFLITEPPEKPTRVIRGFQRVCFHDQLYFLPNFSLTSEVYLCAEIMQVMGNQVLEAGTEKRETASMWEKGHQCWKQTHLSWHPGSIPHMTMWAWATHFMSLNIDSFYKIRVKERWLQGYMWKYLEWWLAQSTWPHITVASYLIYATKKETE